MANKLNLKAYVASYEGYEAAYYATTTASKARYQAFASIEEHINPKVKFGDIQVLRAWKLDELADRRAEEFGKPGYIPSNWVDEWAEQHGENN